MFNLDVEGLQKLLANPQNIVITTHIRPDGDAIGSSMGLYYYLAQLGHCVKVVVPSSYAHFLHFLPQNDHILNYETDAPTIENLIANCDILFALDYNAFDRIGDMGTVAGDCKATKILIDHHLHPNTNWHYALWDTSASSTAELVYLFIHLLQENPVVNSDIATALYTGICADTGRFKYNTRAKTLEITAHLLQLGAKFDLVNAQLFDNFTVNNLQFLGFYLNQRIQFFPEYDAAISYISLQDKEHFQLKQGDTEGLVNYPLRVSTIRFVAMLKETPDKVKISFRSKGACNVQQLAKQHFSGGGHKNASGGVSYLSLEETIKAIIALLPAHMKTTITKA